MNTFALRSGLLAASLAALAAAAPAQVLFQDTFDMENGGNVAGNTTTLNNFNVTDGTVDILGPGFFDFYPGNGLYLDLDGGTSNASTLESKTAFSFLSGVTYRLSFELGGSTRGDTNTVNVSIGSLLSQSITLQSSDPLAVQSFLFTPASATSATLVFESLGGDNLGLLLDDVKIEAVPEPASMAALGLGALGLLKRRKRA